MANKPAFPFLDTEALKFLDPSKFLDTSKLADFSKSFGQFKIPGFDSEAPLVTLRKNIEALTAANQLALEGLQAAFKRQGEIFKGLVEESSSAMQDLMSSGAPEEKLAKQADMVKNGFEKAVSNMKELSDMLAKANTEASEVLQTRVSEALGEMKHAVTSAKNDVAQAAKKANIKAAA